MPSTATESRHIESVSDGALEIGEGSLYPALQRLLVNDWVKAEWGISDNNRKARIYQLTAAGRKRLNEERNCFDAMVTAIARVMEA